MLSFEDVKSVLIAVQSNPELHQQALKECSDLYSEMFVAEDGNFTGSDVLQNLNLNDPCMKHSLNGYLGEILQLEKDIESYKESLQTDNIALIYAEILKKEATRQIRYNPFYYDEDAHYDEDEDEEAHYNDADFYHSIDYYPDDEVDLSDEIEARFDELLEKFKSTVYVTLVNYKGECEGESMLIKASHLRKFYSKYCYGD